jgi:hypothetical protein
MQQIHDKRNELQEVEFYKDKEYTESFDFTKTKNLYIELVNGDVTPLYSLPLITKHSANIFTPYFPLSTRPQTIKGWNITTLNDITPNLSKYIPKDNAVLFLTQNDFDNYRGNLDPSGLFIWDKKDGLTEDCIRQCSKITIFLPHGTQSEFQKADEVEKELQEKYGVEEVNLFALHCFIENPPPAWAIVNQDGSFGRFDNKEQKMKNAWFDKLITTNSTGILKPEDSTERLQVIDCKEIFEDLKENNL